MLKYVLKRLGMSIPILIAVLTLVFIIIRIVPGDPAMVVLGDQASAEALAALRTKMGLDVPLIEQYFTFLSGAFRGDLGTSLLSGRAVLDEVMTVLPYTVDLTIAGVLIGVVFGVPLGVLTAVYRNSVTDYIIRVFSLLGLSFPAFYSAILLIIVFSIQFNMFPVISDPDLSNYGQRFRHLVLPATNLGLIMVAYITRSTRSSMLEVLREDYVRTAKAKGVPRLVVITRHALKNALIPIVTVIGLYLGVLIGNSVLTEIVFNRPGLGKLILDALSERDYTMLQGVMVVYAFIIVIVNLITDLTYGLVDPRVKHQ
ncbi:MAG: ABC transporter permease [Deltaproteobacteria bacterium]|nr:MAG: ABC transporter permease [Deltaproteobacteria bacterium]RLB78870.1 MAG: ABC transporter permease [Deltaproteobacteria bacterium]